MSVRKHLLLSAAAAVLGTGTSQIAMAQTGSTATGELEEVVVTAEKREVNLQKVSTSIQVKSGEDLAKTGKKRIDEIMQGTVGIQAQDSQVGVTFFVRGVDSSGGMGNVVAVPILIDGVAQERSESVRGGTLDLARAEIMRGPQSANLGVNALAGAVSLVSNQPVYEYQANGSVDFGNYSLRSLQGVLNVPLSGNQAVRLAYSSDKRKGYISAGAGDSDLTNIRLKYGWKANDNVETVFTISHQNIGGNGVQQGVLLASGHWAPYIYGSPTAIPLGHFNGPAFTATPGQCQPQSGTTMGCPVQFYVVDDGVNFRQRSDAWNDGYPPDSFPNGPYRDTNIDQASFEMNWKTDVGTITLLPAYQRAHFRSKEPPRGTFTMSQDEKQTNPTLDLRLTSNSGGKFEWQAGAYYSYNKTSDSTFLNINFPGASGMGPPGTDPADCTNSYGYCYSWDISPKADRTNSSVYGNGKFSVIDTVRLTGALRYTKDKATLAQISTVGGTLLGPNQTGPFSLANATTLNAAGDWNATTYTAGVEWDVLPATMLYANYKTGYNPGAIDSMSGTVSAKSTLKQIALGFKSQMLNNRLQFNGEFFQTTFYNRSVEGTLSAYIGGASAQNCTAGFGPTVQVSSGGGGFCAIIGQNTATVPQFVSKGVDLDSTWVITPNDRLNVTVELLKAAYDAAPVITGNPSISAAALQALNPALSAANAATLSTLLQGNIQAFVGRTLQNSPKRSATLDYQHSFVLPGGSRITPRVAAVYKTRYWSFGGAPGANVSQILADESNPNNLAWQQQYTKWDAYTSWDNADGKLTLTGYVKNLSNKVVLANYTDPYVSLEAPRTYGVTFSANF